MNGWNSIKRYSRKNLIVLMMNHSTITMTVALPVIQHTQRWRHDNRTGNIYNVVIDARIYALDDYSSG
jgi:hypothetical protein